MAQKNVQELSKSLAARIYDAIRSEMSEPVNVSRSMAHDVFLIDALKKEDQTGTEQMEQLMADYLTGQKDSFGYEAAFVVSDASKLYYSYAGLNKKIEEVNYNKEHLTDYAVNYFKNILKKYGEGRDRKTEIGEFGQVSAVHVALANQKLYVNRKEGFLGTGMKKEEYLFDVSEYDDLIVFKADGSFKVVKVSDKDFVGKNIVLVEKFNKHRLHQAFQRRRRDPRQGLLHGQEQAR